MSLYVYKLFIVLSCYTKSFLSVPGNAENKSKGLSLILSNLQPEMVILL